MTVALTLVTQEKLHKNTHTHTRNIIKLIVLESIMLIYNVLCTRHT